MTSGPRDPTNPSPRDIALIRLDRADLPPWRSGLIKTRSDFLSHTPPHPREAGLVEALYVGAVKSLLPLRFRISQFSGRPIRAIDPLVQKILVLAIHQILGMDQIPPAIAVDQAVEQCRRFGRAKSAAMVNAILRNLTRVSPAPPPPGLDSSDPEWTYSFPRALFTRLVDLLGKDKACKLCEHANSEPPLTLRLAPNTTLQALIAALAESDRPEVKIVPHSQPGMVVAEGVRKPHLVLWAGLGLAQAQDPTASSVIDFAELHPGLSVLDRCAGRGTKTLQLLQAVGPSGAVHAVDPHAGRWESLSRIPGVIAHRATWLTVIPELPAGFDRVLVDVPCSNSGVLARRPEARYHQLTRDLAGLQKLQRDILADSADYVNPDGLLIYSTCSVWPEENIGIIKWFLSKDHRFVLRAERSTLPAGATNPTQYRDGGYLAVLTRR